MSSFPDCQNEKELSHILIENEPKKKIFETIDKDGFNTPKIITVKGECPPLTPHVSQKTFISNISNLFDAKLFTGEPSNFFIKENNSLFNKAHLQDDFSLKFPINSSGEKSFPKKQLKFLLEKPLKITLKTFKKGSTLIGKCTFTLDDDIFNTIEESFKENKSKLLENPWLSSNNLSIREIDEDNTYHNYCICSKSNCSNVYCSCRKGGKICGELCRCLECKNKSIRKLYRWQRRHKMNEKVIICKCRSTECHSGYCDCFKAGKTCGEECGCINCKNKGETPTPENNEVF